MILLQDYISIEAILTTYFISSIFPYKIICFGVYIMKFLSII